MDIYYIDRKTGKKIKEVVAGGRFLKWIYDSPMGKTALELLIKRKVFSSLYGKLQDTSFSAKKIDAFVRELAIDMTEAEIEDIQSYRCFNDFFARKIKSSTRPIDKREEVLISPADGRVLAYEQIDINNLLQVKGFTYNLNSLLGDEQLARKYESGACLVVRLCPADYHRFHFPDKGIPEEHNHIRGQYYSVNPMALHKTDKVYCQNKREITKFNSHNFGDILLIEVGATCVGSIIQTYKPNKPVDKGDEKGYFKFGGSTVIMLIEPNKVSIDKDILDNSLIGLETKVNMGEGIGIKALLETSTKS